LISEIDHQTKPLRNDILIEESKESSDDSEACSDSLESENGKILSSFPFPSKLKHENEPKLSFYVNDFGIEKVSLSVIMNHFVIFRIWE
jgi:hypothetical protein